MTQEITAGTQKPEFRVPKTVLRIIKHYFFKSSFAVKVPPLGQLKNVKRDTIRVYKKTN